MPLSTIFQSCRDGAFIGGGNWSTWRKPQEDLVRYVKKSLEKNLPFRLSN